MNEQNPLSLLIWFLFLKGLPNSSQDRKQKIEGTIIIMLPITEYNRWFKVTAESMGCILEASLPLLMSTLFQRGPGRKPTQRNPSASLWQTEPYQKGREWEDKERKGIDVSWEGILFRTSRLHVSTHLILPQNHLLQMRKWTQRGCECEG